MDQERVEFVIRLTYVLLNNNNDNYNNNNFLINGSTGIYIFVWARLLKSLFYKDSSGQNSNTFS